MKEKDMQIIEVGMRLFANKGFSATSVQEIATESGISKGAFYLHFKSKDDLLLAILQYHFDMINRAFTEETKNIQNPREKLIREQIALYSHFITHRDLLIMLAKEQAIPRNETIKQLLMEKQIESHENYRKSIMEIYGPDIEPFSWDLTIILEGIIKSYMGVLLFSTQDLDIKRLTEFMLNRLDSMVRDIHKDSPFLTKEKTEAFLFNFLSTDQPSMSNVLKNLEEEIEKLKEDELIVTFQVLKEEMIKEKPRVPVIQGMLSNFNGYTSLDSYRLIISEFYSNNKSE
ncbi:TetR/AcrR family transcriptional regulator [Domibacillus robiginosus]|uniref:TetR/AcrR family transcriptional regulator n=1 Tax=Domibacillus robiginosus TaxID=1071054 RepID=UPI00067E3198|nr:TetR/AcrR family transcriptional regulator [Domibacillus robiginosus]